MEVEMKMCKVYMWKPMWTAEGLHLLTGMENVGLCCLRSSGKERRERVPFSYSLGLSFPTSFNSCKKPSWECTLVFPILQPWT